MATYSRALYRLLLNGESWARPNPIRSNNPQAKTTMEVCRRSLPELDNRWPDQGGHTTSRSLSSRGRNHRTIIIIRSTETCRCCETANWGISAAGSRGHTMCAHGSNRRGPLDPARPRSGPPSPLPMQPRAAAKRAPSLFSRASLPRINTALLAYTPHNPAPAPLRAKQSLRGMSTKSRRCRGSTRTGAATTAGDSGSSGQGRIDLAAAAFLGLGTPPESPARATREAVFSVQIVLFGSRFPLSPFIES